MASGINLISLEVRKSVQFTRLKKKVNSVVYFFLFLFIIVSGIVLGMFFYLSKVFKDNEIKSGLLKSQIKAFEKYESYAIITADRIKLVDNIIEKRKSYLTFLTDLETLFIPGFTIENLNFTTTSLKLEGSCLNNQVLTGFNSQVEKIKKEGNYSVVVFPEASKRADGGYNLSLELKK